MVTLKPLTTVPGWETIPEQGLLATLASFVPKAGHIVEIGSEHGMSASIFFQYSRPDVKIHCVDIDPEAQFMKNLNGVHHLRDKVTPYIDDSQNMDIPSVLKREQISLLFIDGDHHYPGCYLDMVRWSPHVATNGTIVLHDVACQTNLQPHSQHHEVMRGLEEFLKLETHNWKPMFSVDTAVVLRWAE